MPVCRVVCVCEGVCGCVCVFLNKKNKEELSQGEGCTRCSTF